MKNILKIGTGFLLGIILLANSGNVQATDGTTDKPAIGPEGIPVTDVFFSSHSGSPHSYSMLTAAQKADLDGNGYLSDKELQLVTRMYIPVLKESPEATAAGIAIQYTKEDFSFDFRGVEYFTYLREIRVDQTMGRESADGSYTPEWKNCEYLYGLPNLATIELDGGNVTTFNPGQCKALRSLTYNKITGFSTLSFQRNTTLRYLYITGSDQLKTVNINNLKILRKLQIMDCKKLTTVNASKNNKFLYDVDFINLPKLKKVPFSNFKKVTRLIVSNTPKMKKLKIKKLKKLKELTLVAKKMKKIDLTRNSKLSTVLIDGQKKGITILLPKKNSILSFKAQNAKLDDKKASALVKMLNKKKLQSIDLQHNKIKKINLRGFVALTSVNMDAKVSVSR